MAGNTIGRILGKTAQSRRVESFEETLAEHGLPPEERAALEPYVEVAVRKGSNPKLGLGLVALLCAFISGVGLFLLTMNVVVGLVAVPIGPILLWYFWNNGYRDMQRAAALKEVLSTNPRSLLDDETARRYHDLLDIVDEVPDADATPFPSDRLPSERTATKGSIEGGRSPE